MGEKLNKNDYMMFALLAVSALLILFNQVQVSALTHTLQFGSAGGHGKKLSLGSNSDIANADLTDIQSTAMALKTLFPELDQISSEEDAIGVMISEGTPEYSEALGGITFDDPVTSMEYLAKWYHSLNQEVKANNPEVWERYINLAAQPKGVSCEFCCGVGPVGITQEGRSRCGCKHNPAVLALTMGLMKNTEMTDAEVLKEVMKWKAMFFPRDMVGLALQVAGQDANEVASLHNLPGMVGGC